MPEDSNWKTPVDSPRASISYVFGSSSGILVMSTPPTSSTALSITSRFRRPRKSIFRSPSASTSSIGELRHDLLVGALLLERQVLGQRPVADHDAGGVDRVLADEPLERLRQVDDLADDLVGVVGLLQLGARLQAVVEVDLRALGDQLRDLVDGAVRDVEHAARVAHGGARHHRPEGDDLGDLVAAVLLGDVVDDPVAPVDREVDVDVGHRLAARVEEALEEQVVLDRVDVRDLERVGDDRPGRGAAPRADADPVRLREADEVPDDQEVVREAHLADRLQLEPEALLELRRHRSVALLQAFFAELDEVVEGVAPVGRREVRQVDDAELDRDGAALGDLERPPGRLRIVREVLRHLGRCLEVELVGVELPVVRVRERVPGLDAEQRLVCARVLVAEVVDVAGGDERQPGRLRDLRERGVDPLLHLEAGVLDLEVDGVLPEDVGEPRRPPPRPRAGSRSRAPCRRGPRGSLRARSGPSSASRAGPSRRAACSSSPRGSPPRRA